MAPTPYRAFTVKWNGHADRIMTRVGVRAAFDPTNPPPQFPVTIEVVALWDKGEPVLFKFCHKPLLE